MKKALFVMALAAFFCGKMFCEGGMLVPSKVYASSTLQETGKPADFYGASNITDCSWKSWVEGAAGDGLGESITMEFDSPVNVGYFVFRNGYGDLRYYYSNNRVKEVWVYAGGRLIKKVKLKDVFWAQTERIFDGLGENVTKLTFVIKDVYRGTKYTDTCLSEITIVSDDSYEYMSSFTNTKDYELDPYTKAAWEKLPRHDYSEWRDLFINLFYTDTGIPCYVDFADPISQTDAWAFKQLDFYMYRNGSWVLSNDSEVFAGLKQIADDAFSRGLVVWRGEGVYRSFAVCVTEDNYTCHEFDFDGKKIKLYIEPECMER